MGEELSVFTSVHPLHFDPSVGISNKHCLLPISCFAAKGSFFSDFVFTTVGVKCSVLAIKPTPHTLL